MLNMTYQVKPTTDKWVYGLYYDTRMGRYVLGYVYYLNDVWVSNSGHTVHVSHWTTHHNEVRSSPFYKYIT